MSPTGKGKTYLIKLHKAYRFNLAAFLRFLKKDKSLANLAVEKEVNPFQKNYCEAELSCILKDIGYDKACAEVERFQLFLQRKAADLEDCWFNTKRLGRPTTDYISPANCQFLILLFVWADKWSSITEPVLSEFVEDFLQKSDGCTSFLATRKDGEEKYYTVSQGRLTNLSQLINDGICKIDLLSIADRKRKNRQVLPPGFHHSHVEPFGANGEGATIVEPAGINLSRGMEEIEATA